MGVKLPATGIPDSVDGMLTLSVGFGVGLGLRVGVEVGDGVGEGDGVGLRVGDGDGIVVPEGVASKAGSFSAA